MKNPIGLLCLVAALGLSASAHANRVSATDDCSFIRDAIAALPVDGGEVVIPAGRYTCSSPIILNRDYQRLRGEGSLGSVTIRLADNSNAPLIIMGDVSTPPALIFGVEVANITLDGNRANQQFECWGGRCDGGGNSAIRNNGITVRGVLDGKINDIFVISPRSGGVVTEHGCDNLKIDGLTVTDSQFDGFAGYETENSDLNNMHFFRNLAAGISLDLHFNHNTMRNTLIEKNGDVGIFMRDSSNNTFENIKIDLAGNHGVFVSFASNIYDCPVNNEFRNLDVSNSVGAGFMLNSACENNRLTGAAVFRGNRGGCIKEATWMKLAVEGTEVCE